MGFRDMCPRPARSWCEGSGFSFAATRWRQGLLHARPRHADDQPASDRGETTPPPAPARARSVNTYARPSSHGNIRASRAAATHAAPTACSRPGPPTTRSGELRGRRTPSGRRATTRSAPQPTAQPCQPKLRLPAAQTGAQQSTQHTAHTGGARAAHADAHAHPTRTRAQHARVARQRSAAHRAHWPTAAAAVCHNPTLTHARAHSPLPAHALGVAERNQLV